MKLRKHPRLYVTGEALARLKDLHDNGFVRDCARAAARQAKAFRDDPALKHRTIGHNWMLGRAREMQTRIITLLAAYFRTGDRSYRETALRHVREMHDWECWSWITWRIGDYRPGAIFDLSYGENSATLAIAYDWLHGELSADEKRLFIETARNRALQPCLENIAAGRAWWYKKPDTNWNTVCAGGAGMLALAMMEEAPESAKVLRHSEKSVAAFYRYLGRDGAWPEGIGYWNYGMHYGFMYLLSHENATGRRHPLMRLAGTRNTLDFPLLFSPGGVPCSFGDSNHFAPAPFHFAVAARLGRVQTLADLERRVSASRTPASQSAEMLLLRPGRIGQVAHAEREPFVRWFPSQGWGAIADRWPEPSLYLAVRGGTTEVPHGHMDLTSFFCTVAGVKMINNVGANVYLDSTFSPRRYELYEMNPNSKNVLLVNGVGMQRPAEVKGRLVRGACGPADDGGATGAGCVGIVLDAGKAWGVGRDFEMVKSYRRAFLMLGGDAALVIDRLVTPHPAQIEARLHTPASVKLRGDGWRLRNGPARLTVACAASAPFVLQQAESALTTPGLPPDRILRLLISELQREATIVTLLSPDENAAVSFERKAGELAIRVVCKKQTRTVRLKETSLVPAHR